MDHPLTWLHIVVMCISGLGGVGLGAFLVLLSDRRSRMPRVFQE